MVWILQLALCRHAAQIYRETVPQITALISGIISIESTAATWNNSIQVWRKYFKGSIYEEIISLVCPNFIAPLASRNLPSLSHLESKKDKESDRQLSCTWKSRRAGWGINCHTLQGKVKAKRCWRKENLGCHSFQRLNPFWRCVNGKEDCWVFLSLL